ncbi:MAG: hypothetical protein ACE5KT_06310 [Methanosarcinales archaeon]
MKMECYAKVEGKKLLLNDQYSNKLKLKTGSIVKIIISTDEFEDEAEDEGYLKLAENALSFWNDPREDLYQDYARNRKKL